LHGNPDAEGDGRRRLPKNRQLNRRLAISALGIACVRGVTLEGGIMTVIPAQAGIQ